MNEDRRLTPEEERQRLKEQYKKEMLEHKQKMQQLANARRMQQLRQSLDEVTQGVGADADDMLDRLTRETAEMDARVEMAIAKAAPAAPLPVDLSSSETGAASATRTMGDEQEIEIRSDDKPADPVQQSEPTKTMGDDAI